MKLQISTWAIKNPVQTIILFFALSIAGISSFFKLPINANPIINFPIVTVTVTQSGASPTELENSVTKLVERAVSGLPGIRHINSIITDGTSTTIVEFNLTVDSNIAVSDIREQLSQIRADLPQTIDEPLINRIDVEGGAILNYSVQSNNKNLTDISWFVDDKISKSLLMVAGVQKVSRLGGAEREIIVEVNPSKLDAYKVSIANINQQLLESNIDIPGGVNFFSNQQHTIRVLGAKNSLELLKQFNIYLGENQWVTLGNIANIYDGFNELKTIASFNSESAVGFSIYRAKGSSDTEVEKGVRAALAKMAVSYPDYKIDLISSNVKSTVESYHSTMKTLIEGALLTVIVVFFFLKNWRATLIAAVALPLSILPTFFILYLFDYSLNSITLLALTLVIGILVDDAIVEIENIEKYIEKGERPYIAALKASDAIGFAIVAITLTIVAVFLPVSFIGGFVGKYFVPFGITVSAAVLSSLLVARMVTPLMAAFLMLPKKKTDHSMPIKTAKWIEKYLNFLQKTLDNRKKALALALFFLLGSMGLVTLLPSGFLPTSDVSISQIEIELPPGTPVDKTDEILKKIIKKLGNRSEIRDVFSVAGTDDSSDIASQNKGRLILNLSPVGERELSQKQFEETLIPILNAEPDMRYYFANSNGNREVSIILASEDTELLNKTVRQLRIEMNSLSGLRNVQVLEPLAKREIIVIPKVYEAAKRGVNTEEIASAIKIATIGEVNAKVAKFNLAERQVPIRVLLAKDKRDDLETITNLYINSATGIAIPLNSIADVYLSEGPSKIERIGRQRKAIIEADLNGITVGDAIEFINQLPAIKDLPIEIKRIEYGDVEYMDEMFERFTSTMLLSVFMVFIVLVVLFKDFVQPLTILIALPFSIGGAIIALLLYGAAIDLPVIIGILMLMGIVTKNSILLVEFILEKEREGINRNDAIIQAGKERIRPIVMTTIAMIAGMLPLVISGGGDASFRAPMAIAVIGGLLSSTLLSLLFVPVVYSYMDDLKNKISPYLKKLTSVSKEDMSHH